MKRVRRRKTSKATKKLPNAMAHGAHTHGQSRGTRQAMKKKPEPTAIEYVPTPEEQAVVQEYLTRTAATSVVPRLKVVDFDKIIVDHPNQQLGLMALAEALGVQDTNIACRLIGQLADIVTRGYNIQQHELNSILSLLKGLAPKDNMQAMLAVQIVAVHEASMMMAQQLGLSVKGPEQVMFGRTLSKLVRTSMDLMGALNRCRSSGESVAVQNVLVSQGGHAIVATVGPAVSEHKAASPPSSFAESQTPPGTAPFRGKK